MPLRGSLGDDHDLSVAARRYANAVVDSPEWPLTAAVVDLSLVTFETSRRMKRRHGVCVPESPGRCRIRLSTETRERAGMAAIRETIRHELVHCLQHQNPDCEIGHGPSFRRWVDPLNLSGRCSDHYDRTPGEYRYRLFCTAGCGFVAGRHRWSAVVERAIRGSQVCGNCRGDLRVEGPEGTWSESPSLGDCGEGSRYRRPGAGVVQSKAVHSARDTLQRDPAMELDQDEYRVVVDVWDEEMPRDLADAETDQLVAMHDRISQAVQTAFVDEDETAIDLLLPLEEKILQALSTRT